MLRYLLSFLFIFLIALSSNAFEMKPVPIQQQMEAELRYTLNDNFDEFDNTDKNTDNIVGSKKYSLPKAVLMSAVLPGWGEHYIGQRGKARYFFAVEAVSWLGVLAFRTYGGMREDDMIRYAAVHANAQLEDKDDEFINMVRFYDDIDQFNSLGRVSDPDRPYLEDTPENHWRWESSEAKAEFGELNNSSGEAYRRARFSIGAAVVNRLVSIIDVVLSVRKENDRIDNSFSDNDKFNYKLSINPLSQREQITLTINTPF